MRIPFATMEQEFQRVLLKIGFRPERAALCARTFAENSRDGVASHGLNRFSGFIQHIERGYVKIEAEAEPVAAFGAWEQWDGQLGPGIPNAFICTERAIALAREHGLGCVALKNTNHWMRGGTYGWKAAEAGLAFICWTNTKPNMPAWGAGECRVGNNPLVLAVPRENGPVVLDMAMTQFSYGKLETLAERGETLPLAGGFDKEGNLSTEPQAILETELGLPIGYWKGSGLALLLDLIATLLSGGQATYQIGQQVAEYGVSQVFIAFDVARSGGATLVNHITDQIIQDLHQAKPKAEGDEIRYPGERALRTRRENLEKGIPVEPAIWQQVMEM